MRPYPERRRVLHTFPGGDLIMHEARNCVCGPEIHVRDSVTLAPYNHTIHVSHSALDGREAHETSEEPLGGWWLLNLSHEENIAAGALEELIEERLGE